MKPLWLIFGLVIALLVATPRRFRTNRAAGSNRLGATPFALAQQGKRLPNVDEATLRQRIADLYVGVSRKRPFPKTFSSYFPLFTTLFQKFLKN